MAMSTLRLNLSEVPPLISALEPKTWAAGQSVIHHIQSPADPEILFDVLRVSAKPLRCGQNVSTRLFSDAERKREVTKFENTEQLRAKQIISIDF
jgi:hypothetical protein